MNIPSAPLPSYNAQQICVEFGGWPVGPVTVNGIDIPLICHEDITVDPHTKAHLSPNPLSPAFYDLYITQTDGGAGEPPLQITVADSCTVFSRSFNSADLDSGTSMQERGQISFSRENQPIIHQPDTRPLDQTPGFVVQLA